MAETFGTYTLTEPPVVNGPWSVGAAVGADGQPVRLSQLVLPPDLSPRDRGGVIAAFSRMVAATVASSAPPSVLPVLAGDERNGVLWLAEAAAPGPSLAENIAASGPMASNEIVPFLHSLAAALAPIHAAKLNHGWLAPVNVFPNASSIRLGGWLWSYIMPHLAEATGFSQWPLAAYAAPELRTGSAPDPRAEVYSAAALAAYTATGAAPRDPAAYAGLPPALERALRIGLTPKPADRYQDIKTMTVDLTVEQAIAMTDQADSNVVPTGGDVPDWAHDLLADTTARREAGRPLVDAEPEPSAPEPKPAAAVHAMPEPLRAPVPSAPIREPVSRPVAAKRAPAAPSNEPSNGPVFEWNVGDQGRRKNWIPIALRVLCVMIILVSLAVTLMRHH